MKKFILLFILFILLISCYALEMSDYRNCVYKEEDGLYYNWVTKELCTSLNKRVERENKKIKKENERIERDRKKDEKNRKSKRTSFF